MAKTTKTVAIVAIMLISCMASICVTPVSDAASETPDYKDVKYWGIESSIDGIEDALSLIAEMIPDAPKIENVEQLEILIKALASQKGFDSNDVALDLDVTASGTILGEKIDGDTISMSGGASAVMNLDIKIPEELVTMLIKGNDYVPSENTSIIMFDVEIEIYRHSITMIHLNDAREIIDFWSMNERILHVHGMTNLDYKDGEPIYLPEATNTVDHMIASVMTSATHFTSGGFKFLPSDENDNGWEIDLTAHINRLGTVHNEGSGVSEKILDKLAENRKDKDDSMIINPETHSGVATHEVGTKTFDITATVDRTGDIPAVKFTNNAPEESKGPIFRFFEPFGFIFYDFPLSNLSKIFNENMILDDNEAKEYKDGIAECRAETKKHTADSEINVFFLADDKDIFTQTPIATKTVKYGESVKLDVTAPEKEGMIVVGWAGAEGKKTYHGELRFVHADLYLVPVYAKAISAAPTAEDFKNSDVPLIWLHDVNDDNIVVDVDLIKENRTHMYISGIENDAFKYLWKVSGFGIDGTIGKLDFSLKATDAPAYASEKIDGKNYVYLDANLSGNIPQMTSLYYVLGDGFENNSLVDIYVDNGSGLELSGSHFVRNGMILIHAEQANGFLIVGNDTEPVDPDTPSDKSGSDNTMLIVGAVLAIIVIAAIAVFLMKRNS